MGVVATNCQRFPGNSIALSMKFVESPSTVAQLLEVPDFTFPDDKALPAQPS